MASPNFTPYVDLTINNKTITEVYDASVQYAQTALPEFNPRVGTIENALLEAVAHATGSLITTINSLPDGLMEGLLKLMGFSRVEATPATASVEITLSVNTGATIAAGTVFSYNVFDAEGVLTQYLYETIADFTIASGSTVSDPISVTASNPSAYPDIPVGTELTVVSSTPFILTVTLDSISTVGTDTETDAEYFDRAVTFLGSLSASIATASQLTNYIAVNYPTVSRFKVFDLTQAKQNDIVNAVLTSNVVTLTTRYAHDFSVGDSVTVSDMTNAVYNGTYTVTVVPTTTTFRYAKTNANITTAATTLGRVVLADGMPYSTANVGGAVTISMCDSVGDPISVAQKLIIKGDVESKVVAGLSIYLHDMNLFYVDVAATVVVEPNYSTSDVGTAVSEAIEAYLSVAGWDFATSVSSMYLTTIASRVTGVKYVSAMDATLVSSSDFASNDTLNVTVLQKGAIPIGSCTTVATA
jgi:uncharacterized phage protein gp47/JayE